MRIGLGTVQFGMDYGISNAVGQTTPEEAAAVLALAEDRGIRVLDTAALYADSEEVLGQVLPRPHGFRVVTKTPQFGGKKITAADGAQLRAIFRRSLFRMGLDSVYGLLLHRAEDLLAEGGGHLFDAMEELKAEGLVEKIGLSVYNGAQIDRALAANRIDLVQLPLNVLDQRLLRGGHLSRLKERGVEIHARSVFLQGLLLMAPAEVPKYFGPIRGVLEDYHHQLAEQEITPVQGALHAVLQIPEVDQVICGVNNRDHLGQILAAAKAATDLPLQRFAVDDEAMLNPALWAL